ACTRTVPTKINMTVASGQQRRRVAARRGTRPGRCRRRCRHPGGWRHRGCHAVAWLSGGVEVLWGAGSADPARRVVLAGLVCALAEVDAPRGVQPRVDLRELAL